MKRSPPTVEEKFAIFENFAGWYLVKAARAEANGDLQMADRWRSDAERAAHLAVKVEAQIARTR